MAVAEKVQAQLFGGPEDGRYEEVVEGQGVVYVLARPTNQQRAIYGRTEKKDVAGRLVFEYRGMEA